MKTLFRLLLFTAFQSIGMFHIYSQNFNKNDSLKKDIPDNLIATPNNPDYSISPINIREDITLPEVQTATVPEFTQDNEVWTLPPLPVYTLTPYSYTSQNFTEGLIIKGAYGRYELSDHFTANVNVFLSDTYIGGFHPKPYTNASLQLDLIYKLYDRVQLVGKGQISLREGINPKIPSQLGGANYYGLGVQFKVTKKIGIGIGYTNSFYRGDWTKRGYIDPVGY